jgi:hypothetical protein
MWRRYTLILLLSFFCLAQLQAQTSGRLTVTVTTGPVGGPYAPRNILAIWIEDSSGKFVKTLLAYANTRKTHLNTWEASTTAVSSTFNVVDATTGATQSSHGTRTCQWNGTDYSGKQVPDGDYKVRMELTDQNATGNTASFTFTKGPTARKLTPTDVLPSFSVITLDWTGAATATNPVLSQSNTIVVYPNPGSGLFTVLADNIVYVEVSSISGKVICNGISPIFDISAQPIGIYFVRVKTDQETVVRKIIRN